MTKLGFGKHGDDQIEDVPEDYLRWLIKNSQEKIDICKEELLRRQAPFNASWMGRIVNDGFVANNLASLSAEDFDKLKRARDALLKAIQEAAQGTPP